MVDERDPEDVAKVVVGTIKSGGLFDQFRRECVEALDKMEQYRQLQRRVENHVASFLSRQSWSETLSKNKLRESLRQHINQSEVIINGVQHIINEVLYDQASSFNSRIDHEVDKYLDALRAQEKKSDQKPQSDSSTTKVTGDGKTKTGRESSTPERQPAKVDSTSTRPKHLPGKSTISAESHCDLKSSSTKTRQEPSTSKVLGITKSKSTETKTSVHSTEQHPVEAKPKEKVTSGRNTCTSDDNCEKGLHQAKTKGEGCKLGVTSSSVSGASKTPVSKEVSNLITTDCKASHCVDNVNSQSCDAIPDSTQKHIDGTKTIIKQASEERVGNTSCTSLECEVRSNTVSKRDVTSAGNNCGNIVEKSKLHNSDKMCPLSDRVPKTEPGTGCSNEAYEKENAPKCFDISTAKCNSVGMNIHRDDDLKSLQSSSKLNCQTSVTGCDGKDIKAPKCEKGSCSPTVNERLEISITAIPDHITTKMHPKSELGEVDETETETESESIAAQPVAVGARPESELTANTNVSPHPHTEGKKEDKLYHSEISGNSISEIQHDSSEESIEPVEAAGQRSLKRKKIIMSSEMEDDSDELLDSKKVKCSSSDPSIFDNKRIGGYVDETNTGQSFSQEKIISTHSLHSKTQQLNPVEAEFGNGNKLLKSNDNEKPESDHEERSTVGCTSPLCCDIEYGSSVVTKEAAVEEKEPFNIYRPGIDEASTPGSHAESENISEARLHIKTKGKRVRKISQDSDTIEDTENELQTAVATGPRKKRERMVSEKDGQATTSNMIKGIKSAAPSNVVEARGTRTRRTSNPESDEDKQTDKQERGRPRTKKLKSNDEKTVSNGSKGLRKAKKGNVEKVEATNQSVSSRPKRNVKPKRCYSPSENR